MAMRMVGFSRNKSTDRVWDADILDENMEPQMGPVQFTFDKKTIYNFWTDYKKLSPEQKWLFDDANEFWAKFKATEEEYRELEKLHPNWKLPDDLEDEPVNYELVDIEEFSDEGFKGNISNREVSMDANEKRKIIQELLDNPKHVDYYYKALEDMGDLKSNYYDYISTEPMSCDKELRRVPAADYELCTALLTMLLREDHFCNGSFAERLRDGDVQPLLERMLEVVE